MNRKKFLLPAMIALLVSLLTACGGQKAVTDDTRPASEVAEPIQTGSAAEAYTKYADYEPMQAVPTELIPGTNHNVLIAYFSRSGNTNIKDDVDAVSSASLTVNEDGSTLGNTEQIAGWIAEMTGGDLFLIQTEYTYPVDYDQTVEVGEGQDTDGYRPNLREGRFSWGQSPHEQRADEHPGWGYYSLSRQSNYDLLRFQFLESHPAWKD